MKYKSLIGRRFDFTGFKYTCNKDSAKHLSDGRGFSGMRYPPVVIHEIYVGGVLDGQEYVGEKDFFYPISELERTGQIGPSDLLIEEYLIY